MDGEEEERQEMSIYMFIFVGILQTMASCTLPQGSEKYNREEVHIIDSEREKERAEKGKNNIDLKNYRRENGRDTSPIVDETESVLSGWKKNSSKNLKIDYVIDDKVIKQRKKSIKLTYTFKKKKAFWGYIEKDLSTTRNWREYDSISFWSYIPVAAKDLIGLSVMLYEEDGSAYIAQHARGLKTSGWEKTIVPFSKYYPAGTWTSDENDRLDLDQIKKVGIGIFQPIGFLDKEFTIYLSNIRAVRTKVSRKEAVHATQGTIVRENELQKYEPPDGSVYHGAFAFSTEGKDWGLRESDWEEQVDVTQLMEYEKICGRPVNIVSFVWFFDWDFPKKMCEKIYEIGKVPHVGITTGEIRLSEIVQGKVDRKISEWAEATREYGRPVFFRFLPEMNGNWNSYSEAFDPIQNHQMYILAWRHVVNEFRKAGADNIIWVWSPTSVDVGNNHWTEYYPGDDYVDWVGMSVYSFLGDGNPETLIMGIYKDYAARKPIMISESGAGDADNNPNKYSPGNKYIDNPEKWIQRFFDTLENKAPRVKAFIWFNVERERVWKIQESPSKIEVFRKRLDNERYGAKIEESRRK